jgi:hypothetical protein
MFGVVFAVFHRIAYLSCVASCFCVVEVMMWLMCVVVVVFSFS